MNVLAIDTSTEILSVAVRCERSEAAATGGSRGNSAYPRVYASTRDIGLRHSQLLMPMVDRLLDDAGLRPADLDLVACTRGPGSFTGLRIGMSTAKGLSAAIAAARGLQVAPLVSVPTLAVMAHAVAAPEALVVPVIDGRKDRFYAALFHRGTRLTADLDLSATDICARVTAATSDEAAGKGAGSRSVVITGPHAPLFISRAQDSLPLLVDPSHRRGHAETLAAMAVHAFETQGADAPDQGPVYVRSSDAEISRKQPHRRWN